jgi:outer membrane protein
MRNAVLALAASTLFCFAQTPPPTLTLRQAETLALKNHPLVQASQLNALAAKQVITETKAAEYPMTFGSLTGAGAIDGSRIAAGGINNPIIYNRYSDGFTTTQLLTDFGRTHHLIESSSLHAQAEDENAQTARANVLIGVDQAYYEALRAQAFLRVAGQTVKERQLVSDQVTELARNRLKSGLDVSFANVNLGEAKLTLAQAQNEVTSAFAQLAAAMGSPEARTYTLVDEPLPGAPPTDIHALIAEAMHNRPELASLRYDSASAHSYATAERDLRLPSISAIGAAGFTPLHQAALKDRYAAAGVDVNIPIFNGRLFSARASEAQLRAEAADQNLRQEADAVARDVRVAWLDAQTAYQRLALTQQLLNHASLALDLAQQRYKLGIGSIVELSQAQLNQTQALIEQSGARYDYQAATANLNYQIGVLH